MHFNLCKIVLYIYGCSLFVYYISIVKFDMSYNNMYVFMTVSGYYSIMMGYVPKSSFGLRKVISQELPIY